MRVSKHNEKMYNNRYGQRPGAASRRTVSKSSMECAKSLERCADKRCFGPDAILV